MTEEERRIITDYVTRVSGAVQAAAPRAASPWGGSVPSTAVQAAPNLPPVDGEADRLIGDLFARYPEARYRITQTAFVQEAALVQAQNRIQELEWQLENAQRQAQAAQAAPQRGGLFGGMFGGGQAQQRPVPMAPPPQPMMPPGGYAQQQMLQQGRGSGFLGTALTTAAGVAGGMVLGNALMGMFSGGAAHAASAVSDAATSAGGFAQEQVATPAASPWTDPGAAGQDASPVQDAYPAQDASYGGDPAGGWGQQDDAQADYGGMDDAGYDDEI